MYVEKCKVKNIFNIISITDFLSSFMTEMTTFQERGIQNIILGSSHYLSFTFLLNGIAVDLEELNGKSLRLIKWMLAEVKGTQCDLLSVIPSLCLNRHIH